MAAMSPFVINLTRHKEASQRADYGSIKISIRANGSTSGQATERAEQTASQVSALCHALTPAIAVNNAGTSTESCSASTIFYFRLQDFTTFRSRIDKLNQLPSVESIRIDWKLSGATRQAVEAGLRVEAAADALEAARTYCSVLRAGRCLNLSNVDIRPLELTELVSAADTLDDKPVTIARLDQQQQQICQSYVTGKTCSSDHVSVHWKNSKIGLEVKLRFAIESGRSCSQVGSDDD